MSWWFGGGGHATLAQATRASVAILAVASMKIQLIGLFFVALKEAPAALRGIFEGYVVLVAGSLIGMYLAG